MTYIADQLSKETLQSIALRHKQTYLERVGLGYQGHPNINLEECQQLLGIWAVAAHNLQHGEELSVEAKDAIDDAILSGEYDGFLKPEEKAVAEKFYEE